MDVETSMPVTDYKKVRLDRARIGWHVRLRNGRIGRIVWMSVGAFMVQELPVKAGKGEV